MTKPKISHPQALPAIFEAAKDETNWLLFSISEPDAKGHRSKIPLGPNARGVVVPWRPGDTTKAAKLTFAQAKERARHFAGEYTVEEINRRAKASHADWIESYEAMTEGERKG